MSAWLHVWIPRLVIGCVIAVSRSAPGQEPAPPPPSDSVNVPTTEAPTLASARELLTTGQYEEAEVAFARLAEEDSTRIEASLGLAETRLRTGQHDRVIADLDALKASSSAPWHALLAQALREVGRYAEALEHYREAHKLKPDFAAARLGEAEVLETLGRRDEAIEAYRWFEKQVVERGELPRDAAWITATAVGFVRVSVLTQTNVVDRTKHALNEMLQAAYSRVDRRYWPARIAAAELLRARYNNDEERGSVSDYTAALRINGKLPEAFAGLGEVALNGWRFEDVERLVDAALEVNPRFAPAHRLRARQLIVERKYDEALGAVERALAVNPRDVEALAIAAAAHACLYDNAAVARRQDRANEIQPNGALFHREVGVALSLIRQFAASERELLRAVELDPTDANARTELGMMYMNWGYDEKARAALDAAWAMDKYNERTKHTLELLDDLKKFAEHESAHFIVRYDPREDPGLGEFVAIYLEEMYAEVTGDFEAEPGDKTIVEMYPSHRALGVRITGRPFIHTVGASTGRVIAMATPKESAGGMGPYNIEDVLKHEFTHTVTLAATDNRIPHWFTEGLAVYQENNPRSFAWAEMLADAIRRDRLFTLESIDWGFIRPKHPNDRQMAYAQSEWMCEYIVERWGYAAILDMIERYREGWTQPRVFGELLKTGMTEFDAAFQGWAKEQARAWGFDLAPVEDVEELRRRADEFPEDATLRGRLARAEFDAGSYDKVIAAARTALEKDENEPNALEALVTVLWGSAKNEPDADRQRSIDDSAVALIERLDRIRPANWIGPKYRGEIALRRKDWDAAEAALRTLQRVCPMDPASWRGLGGVYLERGDREKAIAQLRELARIEDPDGAVAFKVGELYRQGGSLKDAHFWIRRAIAVQPFRADWHRALADVSLQQGDSRRALGEYLMMTRLAPRDPHGFEGAAFAAVKLGDESAARELARRAVELDPASKAKSLLP